MPVSFLTKEKKQIANDFDRKNVETMTILTKKRTAVRKRISRFSEVHGVLQSVLQNSWDTPCPHPQYLHLQQPETESEPMSFLQAEVHGLHRALTWRTYKSNKGTEEGGYSFAGRAKILC